MNAKNNLATEEGQAKIQGLRIGRPSGLDDSIGEKWLRGTKEERAAIEEKLSRELNVKLPSYLQTKVCAHPNCKLPFAGRLRQKYCSPACGHTAPRKIEEDKMVRMVVYMDQPTFASIQAMSEASGKNVSEIVREMCQAYVKP